MKLKQLRTLKIFKALSNGIRYQIICLLSEKKYSVNELVNYLNKTESTISGHLKILRDLDIVSYYTDKNKVIYSLKKIELFEVIKNIEKLNMRN